MSKFERNFKIFLALCQTSVKLTSFTVKASLALWGISIGAGAMCDYYKNKIREEKLNNKNK